jgi:hypothetical protein
MKSECKSAAESGESAPEIFSDAGSIPAISILESVKTVGISKRLNANGFSFAKNRHKVLDHSFLSGR